jgi:hypothetical protein
MIIINPGTFNTPKGDRSQSEHNIKEFIKQLGVDAEYKFIEDCSNGRHSYKIWNDNHSHIVDMPAIPLKDIIYKSGEKRSIFEFPRLYVDGSSWLWEFALRVCFDDRD